MSRQRPDVRIEPATPQDRDVLVALADAQLREHEIVLAPERLARAIDGALAGPHVRGAFLLARTPDRPRAVGFAYLAFSWSLEHGGRACWLEELHVVPELRERGIGARLLRAAVELARSEGCAAIDLEVEADRARAEHLYEREGFERHSRARFVRRLSS